MTPTIEIQSGDQIVVKRKSRFQIYAQILQGLLGAVLLGFGIYIVVPLLREQEKDLTMIAVLGLGIFLVGLDIIGRAIRP